MSNFWTITSLLSGYLVTLVLIRWVILTKKKQPASTVAWILAIVALPYLGGVLFLFFGINRVNRRKRRAAGKRLARQQVAEQVPEFAENELAPIERLNEEQVSLMRMAMHACGTVPTAGNRIELIDDTKRAFGLIEQAVLNAEKTIHLEYYIWRADKSGRELRDLLIARAKEGLQVRLLYDGIGTLFFLNRRFLRPMEAAGIETYPFLPGRKLRERWSLNLRNHRKIVVVDGRIGFTGGMNIGDEYLGRNNRLGFWRDTHLKLEGPTVQQLQQVFAEDWYYATGERLTQREHFPHQEAAEDVLAQVVSGGPDDDLAAFYMLMFMAINEARERITLATSYFVPPDALVTALQAAALRGVQVRLLLAGRSANPITLWAARSYYEELLQSGVQIHEYTRGILHSKTLTIDGHWSMVGTPNFDARSLLLNFEVGVCMYSRRVAKELEDSYEEDLVHARRIVLAEWNRRPARRLFIENVARLFAPIM